MLSLIMLFVYDLSSTSSFTRSFAFRAFVSSIHLGSSGMMSSGFGNGASGVPTDAATLSYALSTCW